MFNRTYIKKNERGLRFVRGDFERLLTPGEYRFWAGPYSWHAHIEKYDTLSTLFRHPMLELLVREPALKDELLVVDLKDKQRALIWRDGRLEYILGTGLYALWRTPYELALETFDVDQFRFDHPKIETVLAHPDAAKWLDTVNVDPAEDMLLFRNGKLVERLDAGRHVFWKGAGRVNWKMVDRREQSADVAGQEIMTSDKVTLRVNLVVTYQVADAVKAVTTVSDYAQTLYREAQLALRAAIGTRTLDALLGDKEVIGGQVREAITKRAEEFGVTVRSVGLRDIILPGEMKAILNQVITAEKEAQANLIKRREETAAARSQANTAKLLAENPLLARLKELEMLQEILAGTKATFVFGDGDITGRLRSLIDGDKDTPA